MNHIINLQISQVILAYIFIILLLVFFKIRGLSREKLIITSTLRMTFQLILTGYILVYIFDFPNPIFTILILIIMEAFSIFTIIKSCKYKLSKQLKQIIAISMLTGTLSSILYFLFVVIRISPWYDARYFIPVAGMLIGNSMTSISISVNQICEGMQANVDLIESALMLGATPKKSCKTIVDNVLDTALLPTLNTMLGMGIIFLPGMMTGQILSGISPVTAIEYQIAIMLGILGSVSITIFIFINLSYKTFFNKDSQLYINN